MTINKDTRKEVGKRGREEVREQAKVLGKGGRSREDGSGRSQTAVAVVEGRPKEKRQRGELWVWLGEDGEGVGGREVGRDGSGRSLTAGTQESTSACIKAREVAPSAQRSATSNQGVSSTSQGSRQRTDASEIKMEMEIEMKLKDGRSATTKYRVSCLTAMQSVINKVC